MEFPSMRDEERAGKRGGKIRIEPAILPTVGVGSAGPSAAEVPAAVGERKHRAAQVNDTLAVHGFKIQIPSHTGGELDGIRGVSPRSVGSDTADGCIFVQSRFHMYVFLFKKSPPLRARSIAAFRGYFR
jgi:hypothetical protein